MRAGSIFTARFRRNSRHGEQEVDHGYSLVEVNRRVLLCQVAGEKLYRPCSRKQIYLSVTNSQLRENFARVFTQMGGATFERS